MNHAPAPYVEKKFFAEYIKHEAPLHPWNFSKQNANFIFRNKGANKLQSLWDEALNIGCLINYIAVIPAALNKAPAEQGFGIGGSEYVHNSSTYALVSYIFVTTEGMKWYDDTFRKRKYDRDTKQFVQHFVKDLMPRIAAAHANYPPEFVSKLKTESSLSFTQFQIIFNPIDDHGNTLSLASISASKFGKPGLPIIQLCIPCHKRWMVDTSTKCPDCGNINDLHNHQIGIYPSRCVLHYFTKKGSTLQELAVITKKIKRRLMENFNLKDSHLAHSRDQAGPPTHSIISSNTSGHLQNILPPTNLQTTTIGGPMKRVKKVSPGAAGYEYLVSFQITVYLHKVGRP